MTTFDTGGEHILDRSPLFRGPARIITVGGPPDIINEEISISNCRFKSMGNRVPPFGLNRKTAGDDLATMRQRPREKSEPHFTPKYEEGMKFGEEICKN